jgi:hypothetical protein
MQTMSLGRFSRWFAVGLTLGAVLVGASACTAAQEDEDDLASGEDAVSTRNLTSNDFGLKEKEIVLTLDDGPGPRTVEPPSGSRRTKYRPCSTWWATRRRTRYGRASPALTASRALHHRNH